MDSAINWHQIVGTIVISSVTSVVVTQLQNLLSIRMDNHKTILSTLEFFRTILNSDKYLLNRFIDELEKAPYVESAVLLPLFKLNLYSSITDYVGVFKVDPVLAKHITLHLYYREQLISLSETQGIEFSKVKQLNIDTVTLIVSIEEIINHKKRSLLNKLSFHLKRSTSGI